MEEGPRRRWKFGPQGVEEIAPPPRSPQEQPSFDSAAIERQAEAHFTPAAGDLQDTELLEVDAEQGQ